MCVKIRVKVWFEDEEGVSIIGSGGAALLSEIERSETLKEAARRVGMSYRYAYKRVDLMNKRVGRVVELRRGGVERGHASLTPLGRELLAKYRAVEAEIRDVISRFQQTM